MASILDLEKTLRSLFGQVNNRPVNSIGQSRPNIPQRQPVKMSPVGQSKPNLPQNKPFNYSQPVMPQVQRQVIQPLTTRANYAKLGQGLQRVPNLSAILPQPKTHIFNPQAELAKFAIDTPSYMAQSAGRLIQKSAQKKLLTNDLGNNVETALDAAAFLPMGRIGAAKNAFKPEQIQMAQNFTRQTRDIVGRVQMMLETGKKLKQNSHEADYLYSLGETVFGKQVATLTPKQLINALSALQEQSSKARPTGVRIGLAVDDLRKGKPVAQQPISDVSKVKIKPLNMKGNVAAQIDKEMNGPMSQVAKPELGALPREPQVNASGSLMSEKPKLSGLQQKTLEPKGGERLGFPQKTLKEPPKANSSNPIISPDYNYSKLDKLYQETLDRYHPISKLGKVAGKNQVIQNALTGHYGAGSIAKYHLDFELSPILKSMNADELRSAAIAQRDLELAKRRIKGSGQDLKVSLTPETKDALQKLYNYQDNMVKTYLVDTGIMSKESYNAMKANNQSYVPFRRVMDQVDEWLGGVPQKRGVGSVGSQNVIKKIKGSERAIQDPLESIVENTYKLVGLGQRQKVANAIVSLKNDLPHGMIKEFTGQDIGSSPVISVFENGKVKKYLVPREVEEAAKGLNEDQLGTLVKILSLPTKVFRASATSFNPEFMIPNIARDVQSAFVNVGLNPLKFAAGVAHYIKKDAVYQEFLRSGGLTSIVSMDRPFLKETVKELSGKGMTISKPSDLLRIMQTVGALSEQPTRIAAFDKVFNQALKTGKSVEEARALGGYAAQESTVNFGRRGSKTQSINAVYAFLNARAQGVDRLMRTIKNDPKGAATRLGLVVMGPGLATYAWNQQYQSYYDERIVSKNDKQNNFIIMLSDTPLESGVQFIKIPKGDIGRIFNPVEAFLDYGLQKGDASVKDALVGMLQGFSPVTNAGDFIPTALRPSVEDQANKNFFFNQPIVPEYLKSEEAKNQFRSFTPALYRWAGDMLNISPARIQNLVEGYGTGWAKIASMVADQFMSPEYKPKDRGAADINTTPIARRFLGGARYSEDEAQKIFHFKNATETQASLSNEERAFIDSLRGSKDPNDPIIKIYKYTGFLRYPAAFSAYQATVIKDAKGDLSKVDPLYTSPYDQARRYMLYEMQAPGSAEAKALLKNYPDIVEMMDKRERYFKANPIQGQADAEKFDPGPQANPRVQALLDAKQYNDPEVQAYLNARLIYRNNQRAKLGLSPQDSYGNIYGTKGYGGYGGKKKVSVKKVSSLKVSLKGFPKSKPPSVKLAKAPVKTSSRSERVIKIKTPVAKRSYKIQGPSKVVIRGIDTGRKLA